MLAKKPFKKVRMPLDTVPMDVLVTICCFMRIDTLARVRQTCKTLCAALVQAWHDALFVPSGKWYELKNVALAAKYMAWTERVPSPPPTLDTLDNIAFWGTLIDEDRLLATINPKVLTYETDIESSDCDGEETFGDMRLFTVSRTRCCYTWVDTKTEQDYTRQSDDSIDVHSCGAFRKQCQINVCAVVKLSSGVGVYKLLSGHVEPKELNELDFGLTALQATLDVYANSVGFCIFDTTAPDFSFKWWLEHCEGPTPCLEMETAFIQSAANAGRGWNSTRRDVLQHIVAQLH